MLSEGSNYSSRFRFSRRFTLIHILKKSVPSTTFYFSSVFSLLFLIGICQMCTNLQCTYTCGHGQLCSGYQSRNVKSNDLYLQQHPLQLKCSEMTGMNKWNPRSAHDGLVPPWVRKNVSNSEPAASKFSLNNHHYRSI